MIYLKTYTDYIKEKFLFGGDSHVDFHYSVIGHNHYMERINRKDNEGEPITQKEIELDIKKAVKIIAKRNLFQIGVEWVDDLLNTDVLIINDISHLNTILKVEKKLYGLRHEYLLTVKTVMRKKYFVPSINPDNKTLEIHIS